MNSYLNCFSDSTDNLKNLPAITEPINVFQVLPSLPHFEPYEIRRSSKIRTARGFSVISGRKSDFTKRSRSKSQHDLGRVKLEEKFSLHTSGEPEFWLREMMQGRKRYIGPSPRSPAPGRRVRLRPCEDNAIKPTETLLDGVSWEVFWMCAY